MKEKPKKLVNLSFRKAFLSRRRNRPLKNKKDSDPPKIVITIIIINKNTKTEGLKISKK